MGDSPYSEDQQTMDARQTPCIPTLANNRNVNQDQNLGLQSHILQNQPGGDPY